MPIYFWLIILLVGGMFCAGLIVALILLLVTLPEKNQQIAKLEQENERLRKKTEQPKDDREERPSTDAFTAE
jgi:hypothetical protein